jgi:hypothetical protein
MEATSIRYDEQSKTIGNLINKVCIYF